MSDLSEYHNQTTTELHAAEPSPSYVESVGMAYDVCTDMAIEMLATAGYQPSDTDMGGKSIEDDVQTLLVLALFRAPKLMQYFCDIFES